MSDAMLALGAGLQTLGSGLYDLQRLREFQKEREAGRAERTSERQAILTERQRVEAERRRMQRIAQQQAYDAARGVYRTPDEYERLLDEEDIGLQAATTVPTGEDVPAPPPSPRVAMDAIVADAIRRANETGEIVELEGGRGFVRPQQGRRQPPQAPQPEWVREGFQSREDYLAFLREKSGATRAPERPRAASAGTQGGVTLTPAQIEQVSKMDDIINIASEVETGLRGAIASGNNITGRAFGVLPLPGFARDIVKQGGNEGITTRAQLGNLFSTLAQMRSGAAISDQEFERLAAFAPDQNDDEELAQAKVNQLIRALRQMRATRLQNAQRYGRGGVGITAADLDPQIEQTVFDKYGLEVPE